jgi:hypothetical protein
VHGAPPDYSPSPLTWNDKTRVATRYFTTKAGATQIPAQIGLQYALPTSSRRLAPPAYDQTRTVTIHGRPGSLFTYSETVDGERFSRWTILWTRADRSQLCLTVSGPSAVIPSRAFALMLAADIR